jgi:polyhydroxybutyrate depolymerase
MKTLILPLFSLLTLTVTAQPQQKTEQIIVDGITRRFVTYIPLITNVSDKLPVIISLHGRLGTGEGMMGFADFRPIAQKEKFIIVCPDGIDKSWNDGRPTPAQKKGINDVKFIDQLIIYGINTYHADANRIYVTGMSNGGFMTSRLACELNNRIAAIAVVGASMVKNVDYHPAKSTPVMYIQGTKDPLVPFNGGTLKGAGGEVYSHADALKLWIDIDHCDGKPIVTNYPDDAHDGTNIIKEEYSRPGSGVKVIGYTINHGGHTWPGGTQYLPKFMVGAVSHNMNACEVIWDFFKGCKLVD